MNPGAFPDVAELVPQAPPMLLLARVLEHESTYTVCSASVADSALFAEPDGSVPSWLGLEYMAQCAAVHGGMVSRARGETPRPGLLLGSRRLTLFTDVFEAERVLRVTARHHRGESGLVSFDCSVCAEGGDGVLAEGRINLYIFRDWSELGVTGLG